MKITQIIKNLFIALCMQATIFCIANPASAQGPVEAGVTGWFEANTFHPTSNPHDGFFLERGRVLENLQLAMETIFQIDDDPLTWQRKDTDAYNETAKEINQLMVLHLNGAIGLLKYAQIGVQFPLYLDRGTSSGRAGGIGDLRVAPKLAYRFETNNRDMGLAISLPINLPTGDATTFTGQGQITIEPRLAADWGFGRFRLIANAGVLIASEHSGYGLTTGPGVVGGIGGELNLHENSDSFRLISEVQVRTPFADFFGRSSTPADMLLGVLYIFDSRVSLKGAMGTGLSAGAGAPDFRLIVALGFAPKRGDKTQKTTNANEKNESAKSSEIMDSDGDGIINMDDFCPNEAEDFDTYNDEDGCLDADNDEDGILDIDDACPMAQENLNGVQDDDGCPEEDRDKDGILDPLDKCPDEPEDLDGFEDTDGCPDTDNDHDSISDENDNCPDLPESSRNNISIDGCPDTFVVAGDAFIFSDKIQFAHRKARLKNKSADVVKDIAAAINANPSWTALNIAVHTNGRGNAEQNQRLSENRAMAVLKALASLDVAPERLVAEGRGDSQNLKSPKTRQGRKANERVEIKIIKRASK